MQINQTNPTKHLLVKFHKSQNEDDGFCPSIAIDLATIDSISEDRGDKQTLVKQKNGGKIKLSESFDEVFKIKRKEK